jgi:diadenosine tetraphosphatase ApaH/serine/threonine PP2A family protein phosphatase
MLALLYDVHGNLAALDAVLDDAEGSGAQRFLLGGDYTLFGPHPAETLQRLRELDAEWIRGNGERWTADPGFAPDDVVVQSALQACRRELGPVLVEELSALPETLDRPEALYCHGSPRSDVRSFLPEPADDEAELLKGVDARRLVFGHTHLPFRREGAAGVELVNPGSVGMPFDGDLRAAYALVHDDGQVEHRRVEYDHRASVAALCERFDEEFAATVGRRIEQARVDV